MVDARQPTLKETAVPDVLRDLRVLVVDDDAIVRYVLAEELRDAGADVVEAADGPAALAALADGQPFDIMTTDVRMPMMDGWTLAEQARERYPELPILYVSGWSEIEPRPVTNSRVIPKPFRPSVIPLAIQVLTGRPG